MTSLNLSDTDLTTIQIMQEDKGDKYEYIHSGTEGAVYKYDDNTAMKFYLDFESDLKRRLKLEKVELLAKLDDEQATFPKGLVGYESGFKEGYFMRRVEPFDKDNPNIWIIRSLFSTRDIKEILADGELTLQRLHLKGFIHGDIRPNNILLDSKKRAVFIDIDNGMYKGYDYDIPSYVANSFFRTYKTRISPLDNDKYMYALMVMQIIIKELDIGYGQAPEFYESVIGQLNVSREIKQELLYIFSPKKDKPYIGPILEEIDPSEKLLSLKL